MNHPPSNQLVIAISTAVVSFAFLVLLFGGDVFDWSRQAGKDHGQMLVGLVAGTTVAFACHWVIRRWFKACTISTGILTGWFVALSLTSSSPPGEFWLFGLFTIVLASFVLSAVVGWLFAVCRCCWNI